jgi:nucleoside-diphosphate-sugar epimerase
VKYFVTGATGFVGGALARRLRRDGHEVVALVRHPARAADLAAMGMQLARGDVVDKESMRAPMTGVDGIFHVAGWYKVGVRDKSRARAVNVRGTRHVLELMRELKIPKGVYTSTLAVNSDTHGDVVDETYQFYGDHLSVYDRTKAEAHDLARGFMRQGLPLVIAQPGMIYGPGDQGPMHDVFQRHLEHRIPMIPRGLAFCWTHIDDVVSGHVLVMEKGRPGQSYFLCGPAHTLAEGLEMVEHITGVPAPRVVVAPWMLRAMSAIMGALEAVGIQVPDEYSAEYLRVNAGSTYLGTNAKARRELGWAPRSLDEGLPETLRLEMEALRGRRYDRPRVDSDHGKTSSASPRKALTTTARPSKEATMSWPADLKGQTLEWRKSQGEKRTHTLLAGGRTVATLRRERGSAATAESGGRRWKFKRAGFLRPRITIQAEGSEFGFRPQWHGGGELVFTDGRRFVWRQRSFWRQEWAFSDAHGQELLKLRCGLTKGKGKVEVTPAGAEHAQLPLLVLLSWYLILLMAQDVAAGSAAAAGAAAAG